MSKSCEIQIEKVLHKGMAECIMRVESITLTRYKRIYNPEVDFFPCGYKAKYRIVHKLTLTSMPITQYVCKIHRNQIRRLCKKSDLFYEEEEIEITKK